jgi:methionyl-tRNA formyltransferase
MESVIAEDFRVMQAPRVLFFGMQGNFSSPSLMALLESGVDVCAICLPATLLPGRAAPPIRLLEPPSVRRRPFPLIGYFSPTSILQLAWARHIPVWEIHKPAHKQTLSTLGAYKPDMICVACFSLLIPPALLTLPRLGCLNVHPALLPANRGPVPLFWTFREGHAQSGVTIHFMSEKLDRGDILAQEVIPVPDGIRYEQLERECARRGGRLLTRTAWDLYNGEARPMPQDEARSSYHSFPDVAHISVENPRDWGARHLYNYIRGIAGWNGPIELCANNEHIFARDAISYCLGGQDRHKDADPLEYNEQMIQCRDGQVRISKNC